MFITNSTVVNSNHNAICTKQKATNINKINYNDDDLQKRKLVNIEIFNNLEKNKIICKSLMKNKLINRKY